MTRLVHLDTRHRQNVSSPSGTPLFRLQGGPIRCRRVRLVSATFPHAFPTFTSADSTFVVTPSGGAAATVTLPTSGTIHTLATLATAIATAANAALGTGSGFTVTADAATLRLTLTHPTVAFTATFANDRTAAVLGFGRAGAYSSAGTVLASSHACELVTPTLHIVSRDLGGTSYHPATGDVPVPLFVIPVTEDGGGVVTWNERTAYEQAVDFGRAKDISQLSFELLDANGRLVQPLLNWSLTLCYME